MNDMNALQCAKTSIFKTIDRLKHLFLRSTGNQWKIPKLHEQLHIAHNIFLFGSHQNIDTGPQEHNHIANSKGPSQHTQKRKHHFDWQIVNWLNDQYTINNIINLIDQHQTNTRNKQLLNTCIKDINSNGSRMASKFEMRIILNSTTNNIDINYQWITKSKTYGIKPIIDAIDC